VVEELRSLGIRDIAMLTGDSSATAQAIAGPLDINAVHASLLPADKADFIQAWQQPSEPNHEARRVAMVGDGINDAPALARAHVGLAVGTGPDVAAEAGDIVFMGQPLRPLPLLVRLSRETVRIIRQNILIFAFVVNGLGILLTAWLWPFLFPGWYEQGPIAAVIYHQLGSFAVLLNSMRLLWFERAGSHRWSRFRDRVDRWMEKHLDIGEGLHWLSHHWKPIAAAVAGLVVAGYALSGLTQIGPDEVGIVRRFGRPTEE